MNDIMTKIFKHQPRSFYQLCHQNDATEMLRNMSQVENPPHILIHGASGSGRYTRTMLFLKEIYGNDALIINEEKYEMDEDHIIVVKTSPFHVEFNPSSYGLRDRVTLQWIIDKSKIGFSNKTLIIHEADKLTKEAQFAVRRAMETGRWRYVFITENVSSLMKPLRSRCLDIRVELPTYEELNELINIVARNEKFNLSQKDCNLILSSNNCNYRTTLMSLFVFMATKQIPKPSWKRGCEEIVKTIVGFQDAEIIPKLIRPKLCEFIENGISPSLVLTEIFNDCMSSNIDQLYKLGVVEITSKYDKSLKQGKNPWIHVENCITALMTLFSAHQ